MYLTLNWSASADLTSEECSLIYARDVNIGFRYASRNASMRAFTEINVRQETRSRATTANMNRIHAGQPTTASAPQKFIPIPAVIPPIPYYPLMWTMFGMHPAGPARFLGCFNEGRKLKSRWLSGAELLLDKTNAITETVSRYVCSYYNLPVHQRRARRNTVPPGVLQKLQHCRPGIRWRARLGTRSYYRQLRTTAS